MAMVCTSPPLPGISLAGQIRLVDFGVAITSPGKGANRAHQFQRVRSSGTTCAGKKQCNYVCGCCTRRMLAQAERYARSSALIKEWNY